MRENTPPRPQDIEDDEGEVIHFDNDVPPEDDDELEMEEVTLEELERRLGDDEDFDEEQARRTPVEDKSQFTFEQHTAPVFGCAMHPLQSNIAATGGEDDKVFVWQMDSGKILFEFTEHKDTVTEVHFNHDGQYLATCDLAGEVFVHKVQSPERDGAGELSFRKVWEYSMGDMSWMKWHDAANVLIAGSENGEVYVWRIPSGECKILAGVGVRCEAGCLTGDGKKLFVAYANGVLKLWDLKTSTAIMEVEQQNPMSHQEGAATTVSCEKNNPLYMSGGEDGR